MLAARPLRGRRRTGVPTELLAFAARVADPNRAPGQPGDLPAVDATVPDRRADRRDRARLRARPGGRSATTRRSSASSSGTRPSCASSAYPWRSAPRASSTPSPATGSPAATTRCPTSPSRPTRRRRSASRPGCGSARGLAAAASSGLAKLRAAGIDVDPHATLGVEPVVTVDPAFEPLTAAVRDRQAVTFDYRTPEDDAAATRRLQPWGVVCWRGRWYVVGHDLDRAAARCFRLSRIVSRGAAGRPARRLHPARGNVDLIGYVAQLVRAGRADRPRHVSWSRRAGRPACGAGPRRPSRARTATGWCCATPRRARRPAGWSATAPTSLVLDPPEVRDAVVALLAQIAAAHADAAARGAGGGAGMTTVRGPARPAAQPGALPAGPARHRRSPRRPPTSASTERQLREDLELLWVCGLPGYGPGDLIDMAFDGDRVTHHLRRRHRPAAAAHPGRGARAGGGAAACWPRRPAWPSATRSSRALAKIEHAAGDLADAPVAVRLPGNADRLEELRDVVAAAPGAADHLLHGDPRRDHRAGGRPDAGPGRRRPGLPGGVVPAGRGGPAVPGRPHRRLDRARRAGPGAAAGPRRPTYGPARSSGPTPDLPLVTLRVGRGARWITE